jgi:acetyl-CoA carboxylase biotin carboxyl carrier protein
MDFKEIQELIKLVSKLGIGEVTVKEGDFKITVKSAASEIQSVYMPAAQTQMVASHAPIAQSPAQSTINLKSEIPAAASSAADSENTTNLIAIKSPMVGTFYRSTSPDKPAFVKVGDEVTSGSTVCIIEAMKLFNEIESEIKGKIVKVMVEDASPVEYDQVLFLVDPK